MAAVTSLLIGCARHEEGASIGISEWPYADAVEVRAFQFDVSDDQPGSLIWRGELTENRTPPLGAPLSKPQIEKLRSIILHGGESKKPSLCYVPHHGFVFYDADSAPLGYIELSFQCFSGFSRTKKQMSGEPPYPLDATYLTESGWGEMAALFDELGISVSEE